MIQEFIKFQVVGLATIISVYTDLRFGKIFNKITFPLFFSGLIYNLIFNKFEGFVNSLIGAFIAFAFFYIFFQLGGVGGGDVKLITGIGSWIAYPSILLIIFLTSIAGLLISLIYSFLKGNTLVVLRGVVREGKEGFIGFLNSLYAKRSCFYDKERSFKLHIPYSLAIAFGTFFGIFIDLIK
ncbi:MAG: A24 family peptidase [Candidatus Hydrothermales bacterium]